MLDKRFVIQKNAHLNFNVIGKKGSGKSSLVERMCEIYYNALGKVILDFNGSPDLEQLSWCIPDPDKPKHKQVAYPILLIIPRSTEVITDGRTISMKDGSEVAAIKVIYDDTPFHQIILQAHAEQRIVVFCIYLYDNPSKGQKKLADFIFGLPNVMRDHIPTNVSLVVAVRELADLSSNRMKTHRGSGETESKRSLNFLSRQIRHFRLTLCCDTQNVQDLYAAFVANQDILLVKNINLMALPKELQWWVNDIRRKYEFAKQHYMPGYSSISPDRLSHNSFYCIYPDMDYKIFHNSEPGFRHHRPDDDAKALAGVTVRYLTKTEFLSATSEDKILQIQQKTNAKEERVKLLNEAYQLYKSEKAKDPETTWDDIAKMVKFLGMGGKPNGHSLRIAVQRAIDSGLIQGSA